jgi:hypothetical protein
MSSAIVLPAKFDATLCSVSQPKLLESGGKMAYLNYNGEKSLTLQTPSLPSPFGLNIYDKAGPPKYSLDLALRSYQENPKVKSFYKALSDLDNWMLDQAVKNSKLWFKSDMSKEVLKHMYTPCVKFGKDKDGNQTPYPPNVKLNFKKARGSDDFDCAFHDEHSKPIKGVPLEEMLVKKVEVTALMQCTGAWFAAGKFGLSWKAVLIRLDKVPLGSGNMGLLDDDGEPISSSNAASSYELKGGSSFAEPSEFSSRPAKKTHVVADTSDSEEEEEEHAPAPVPSKPTMAQVVVASSDTKAAAAESDEEEEEHAPAPVPKKTVVTKKKIVAASTKK